MSADRPLFLPLSLLLLSAGCSSDFTSFGQEGERGERGGPGAGYTPPGDGDDDSVPSEESGTLTAQASLDSLRSDVVDGVSYAEATVTVILTASGLTGSVTVDDPLTLTLYDTATAQETFTVPVYLNWDWILSQDGQMDATFHTDPLLTTNDWYPSCGVEFFGQITITWGTVDALIARTNDLTMQCSGGDF